MTAVLVGPGGSITVGNEVEVKNDVGDFYTVDAAEDAALTEVEFGPLTTATDHVLVAGVPGTRYRLARVTPTFDNRSDTNALAQLRLHIMTDAGDRGIQGPVLVGRLNILGSDGADIKLDIASAAQDVTGTVFYETIP